MQLVYWAQSQLRVRTHGWFFGDATVIFVHE
jgi:hypothetical protein